MIGKKVYFFNVENEKIETGYVIGGGLSSSNYIVFEIKKGNKTYAVENALVSTFPIFSNLDSLKKICSKIKKLGEEVKKIVEKEKEKCKNSIKEATKDKVAEIDSLRKELIGEPFNLNFEEKEDKNELKK